MFFSDKNHDETGKPKARYTYLIIPLVSYKIAHVQSPNRIYEE